MTSTAFADLDTPCALLSETQLQRNLQRMQTHLNALGVAFRPHVKTHKCIEIARRQIALGARGITVSTLKEAEAFAAAGFADVFYAVALSPDKAARAMALQARGVDLRVVVDSLAAADALLKTAKIAGVVPQVLIEVDVDGHRSGLRPDSPLLLALGQRLHSGGAQLLGVMSHAGSSYDCRTPEQLQAVAELERAGNVQAADHLKAAGLPCPVTSIGSTPTALSASHLAGISEVRAGVYAFFDLVMAGTSVCGTDEVALSVLATVIGHQPEHGRVLIDAGWMAMSRDRGTQAQAVDHGYGLVCDVDGQPLLGWKLASANQEHGLVTHCEGSDMRDVTHALPIGTKLRILPNHACATAAQYSQYEVIQADGGLASWPRFNGW